MAVRLHFIVEGQTEETFVNRTLGPHLGNLSIWVKARCVMTSRRRGVKHRGGILNYRKTKNDIDAWMKEDRNDDARFTTMFDLYRLPADFPSCKDTVKASNPYDRVRALERALKEDITDPRFIPYLQIYEFETLLLSDPRKLDSQFSDRSREIENLVEMTARFESPERINDGFDTAPSKRITDAIPEYGNRKASAGPIVAEKIGLPVLRSKCEHFGEWIGTLESLAPGMANSEERG